MIAATQRLSPRGALLCVLLLSAACARAPSDDTPADTEAAGKATEPTAASPAPAANAAAMQYAHDDGGQAGLALPDAIVRALGTDERVLSCAQGTREGVSQFAADWVAVRRADLDDDRRPDWIVNGRHACLRDGADAAGWWVYADAGDQPPRLLLPAAMAASLDVLASRTRGFRDLRLQRAEDGVVMRYDGERYRGEAPPVASP